MSQYDEERLRRIACSARDTYFNEEQAGKLPNLALIIRDALLEYGRTLAPERTESAAEQSEKSVQAPSGGQPQETAPAADLLPGLERDAERYRARRYTIYKDRLRIEMPQGKNWRPTTFEDFCAEYDAACDKEIEKQATEISRLKGEGSEP